MAGSSLESRPRLGPCIGERRMTVRRNIYTYRDMVNLNFGQDTSGLDMEGKLQGLLIPFKLLCTVACIGL